MAKVAKKLYFDIPSVGRVNSLPGATFDLGGQKRDAVIADTGVVGYTEEPVAPSCDFKVVNTSDVDINVLRQLVDVNISVQDDNGKSWVIKSAWMAEPPQLNGGEISCKMQGVQVDVVS